MPKKKPEYPWRVTEALRHLREAYCEVQEAFCAAKLSDARADDLISKIGAAEKSLGMACHHVYYARAEGDIQP